jgi:hypothetical protein
MDQGTLVENQVDEGKRLIEQLASTGFDVTAAFWVRTREDGEWTLTIASKVLEEKGPAAAYRAVNDALRKLDDPSISMSDIKVIGANNPITRDVHKIQKRYSGRTPIRFGGARFGGVDIEEAYIYSPAPGSAETDERWRGIEIVVFPEPTPEDAYFVEFWPHELQAMLGPGGQARRVPRPAGVRVEGGRITWYRSPEKPLPNLKQDDYTSRGQE